MFPLSITQYVQLGTAAIALLFSAYLGYSYEHSRFMAFKARIVEETRAKEIQYQSRSDEIRKAKDEQISNINSQLVNAISELRKRSSRSSEASNGQSGTGATLYAEDAEFLIREAARADKIRTGLEACYAQYEAIK